MEIRGEYVTYLTQKSFDDVECRQQRSELLSGMLVLLFVLLVIASLA